MNRYTFILEILGGTYISQQHASDANCAVIKWMSELEEDCTLGAITESFITLMRDQITEYGIIPIDDMIGVWIFDLEYEGDAAWGHIIES